MSVSTGEARAGLLVATRPNVYAGLADGDPLIDGAELTAAGYHRVKVAFSTPQDGAGAAYVDNVGILAFGALMSGAGANVTHALLADTDTGAATIRRTAKLARPQQIVEFEEPTIPAGSLRVTVPRA